MEQIDRIDSFKKAFEAGMSAADLARLDASELCYRLIRGRADDEFEYLAHPVGEKKLAWVSQSEDLKEVLRYAAEQTPLSPVIARAMGKPLAWVEEKLRDGYTWKLVIMPRSLCVKADWTGCLDMVQRFYPEVAATVARSRDALSGLSFADIEGQISPANTFRGIKNAGASCDQYIDLHRLVALARPELWQVRGFLFNIIGVNELYKGDGFTYDENGRKSSEEFLVENRRIEEIPGCEVLTISR